MYRRIVALILVMAISTGSAKDSRAQFGFDRADDGTSGERTSTFFDGGKKEPFFKLPKLSSLNPFKSGGSAVASASVVTESATEPAPATSTVKSSSSWFSPMKPLGYIKKPFVYTATKSKQAFVKAVDFLNPFDGYSKAEPSPRFLLATQGYRPQDMNKPVKKPLWHYLLPYDPEPPEQQFNDVGDFLSQGMPSFK